ncbi:MAG TPA: DMT family transporter [Candidatus Nanoarchaeia archaeon]|nr:DMT family transporter [Candidatus Nanoarchaeia archaeon]
MKEVGKKELFGTILILLTAIISGFSIIANKFFVVSIDPLLFTALRAFFIGLIFFAISFYFSRKNKEKFKKTSWSILLLIGIIGGGLAFWLFFSGLSMTLGGRAAFLHKTLPIYATILAFIFLKEKITKKQLIAMGIMLFGLVLMELTKISNEIKIGDFLVLSATILWAVENVISKKAMLNKESNWVVTFSRMFFGSLFLFGIIILTGKINLILSLTSQQLIYIGVSGFLLFLYVLTWYWGLKYINLSKASIILLLSPVISLILGILWLNEQVSTIQLIGSTIILIGAYLIISTKSEKRIKEV